MTKSTAYSSTYSGVLNTRGVLIIGGRGGGRKSLKLLISGEGGGAENLVSTNKWGWDGQLELAISKNKFVKRIVGIFLQLFTNFSNIYYCFIVL